MNKRKYAKIIFFCIILTVFLGHDVAQIQAAQPKSGKSSMPDVGRDNPFAKIPKKEMPIPEKISQSSQSDEKLPELFLETITLKSLDARSVKTTLENLCSEYGRISVDIKSNSLIICDTKESLERIKKMMPKEEVLKTREKLSTMIYRIVYADIKQVENTLKAFISESGTIAINPGSNNILITDFESRIRAIDDFIKEIDRLIPQVLVEVRIYDITSTEDFDLGIEWNAGRSSIERETLGGVAVTVPDSTSFGVGMDTTVGDSTTTRGTTTRTSTPFIAGSYDELVGGSIRLGLLNDAVDIDIALNILHKQGYAELLANPRILVIDNEVATFEIIREIPYLEVSQTSEGGAMTGYKFKLVGVKLEVTPHITRDGMLRLHIVPEFGIRVGITSPPTVDTRKVDTKALVKDGQTVVLGGLRQSRITRDKWKVPLLGDLPLVGGLFQSETETVKDTELLIFITPRIVVETALSPREVTLFKETGVPTPKKLTTRFHHTSEKLEPPMLSIPHKKEKEDQLEPIDK